LQYSSVSPVYRTPIVHGSPRSGSVLLIRQLDRFDGAVASRTTRARLRHRPPYIPLSSGACVIASISACARSSLKLGRGLPIRGPKPLPRSRVWNANSAVRPPAPAPPSKGREVVRHHSNQLHVHNRRNTPALRPRAQRRPLCDLTLAHRSSRQQQIAASAHAISTTSSTAPDSTASMTGTVRPCALRKGQIGPFLRSFGVRPFSSLNACGSHLVFVGLVCHERDCTRRTG